MRFPVSQTRMEAAGCPLHFYHRYVAQAPGSTSDASRIGKLFHAAMDAYIRYLKDGNLDTALGYLDNHWAAIVQSEAANDVGVRAIADQALDLLTPFIASHAFPWQTIVAAERGFSYNENWKPCGWDAPEMFLRGRTDLLQVYDPEELQIIDWKTSRVPMTQEEAEASPQMPLYALMAFLEYPGFQIYRTKIFYVRYPNSPPLEVVFTVDQMDDLKRRVIDFSDGIERLIERYLLFLAIADEIPNEGPSKNRRWFQNHPNQWLAPLTEAAKIWEPKPCDCCAFCRYSCPIADNPDTSLLVIRDEDAARAQAERYLALEAGMAAITEALGFWTHEHGTVQVGKAKFGWDQSERTEYDEDTVRQSCEALGVPQKDYLRLVTGGDLKKLAKKHSGLFPVLEAAATIKVGNPLFNKRLR